MIDSTGLPSQRDVARMLEHMILMKEPGYEPGWVLPPAATMARELGLGPETVLGAYHMLADRGLLTVRQGYGATVRPERDREIITVPPGTVITARMPTFAEQDEWSLEPGVPVLVAGDQVWPADRFQLVVGDDPAS